MNEDAARLVREMKMKWISTLIRMYRDGRQPQSISHRVFVTSSALCGLWCRQLLKDYFTFQQCCCQGFETQERGQGQGVKLQGQGQGLGPALIHTCCAVWKTTHLNLKNYWKQIHAVRKIGRGTMASKPFVTVTARRWCYDISH